MRKFRGQFRLLLAAGCLSLPLPVFAAEVQLAGAGVSVWIPDEWVVRDEAGRSAVGDSEDKVFILLTPLGDSGADPLSDYQSVLDHMVAGASMRGGPRKSLVNGQAAFTVEGVGQTGDGEEIEFVMMMLRAADGRTLLALAVVRGGAMQQYRAQISRIVGSIRALPAPVPAPAPASEPSASETQV